MAVVIHGMLDQGEMRDWFPHSGSRLPVHTARHCSWLFDDIGRLGAVPLVRSTMAGCRRSAVDSGWRPDASIAAPIAAAFQVNTFSDDPLSREFWYRSVVAASYSLYWIYFFIKQIHFGPTNHKAVARVTTSPALSLTSVSIATSWRLSPAGTEHLHSARSSPRAFFS